MPGLGDMRSFWFEIGMLSVASISEPRSSSVAVDGKLKLCAVPWWCTVSSKDGAECMVSCPVVYVL